MQLLVYSSPIRTTNIITRRKEGASVSLRNFLHLAAHPEKSSKICKECNGRHWHVEFETCWTLPKSRNKAISRQFVNQPKLHPSSPKGVSRINNESSLINQLKLKLSRFRIYTNLEPFSWWNIHQLLHLHLESRLEAHVIRFSSTSLSTTIGRNWLQDD